LRGGTSARRSSPALASAFADELGEIPSLRLDSLDAQTVVFEYPRGLPRAAYAGGYVRPQVRLEFGAKSDHDPQVRGTIRPYGAEAFADQFASPATDVPTLAAERTFWEKATMLHERAMRPKAEQADRFSRHYHDVLVLAGTPAGLGALSDPGLLRRVAEHKDIFFKVGGDVYQSARPGSFRLVPPEEVLGALRPDYGRTREMLFDDPMPFDELVGGLRALEARING